MSFWCHIKVVKIKKVEQCKFRKESKKHKYKRPPLSDETCAFSDTDNIKCLATYGEERDGPKYREAPGA